MQKTGTLSVAIGLIALGVVILLYLSGLVRAEAFHYLWPALLILFGVEIIWAGLRHRQEGTAIRYSGWSIALLVLVLFLNIAQFSLPRGTFSLLERPLLHPVNGQVDVNQDIKQVEIRVLNANVTVFGIPGDVLTYEGQLLLPSSSQTPAAENAPAGWKVQRVGDTLQLAVDRRPGLFNFFSLFSMFNQFPYLEVQIPHSLSVEISTSNGSVQVSNTNSGIDATTSNGSVRLNNIQGDVTAVTSNGRIDGTSAIEGDWRLATSNGSIDITLPRDTNATVKARTSNGHIGGDVPWVHEGPRSNRGSSVLGSGDYEVDLRTSNGSIELMFQ